MKKSIHKLLFSFVSLFIIGLGCYLYVNYFIHTKITNFISKELPEHIKVTYQDLDVKSLSGTITVSDLNVTLQTPLDTSICTKVNASKLVVKDLSYFDFLFHKKINISHIQLIEPDVIHYKQQLDTISTPSKSFIPSKPILLEKLTIKNGKIRVLNNSQKEKQLEALAINISIQDIKLTKNTVKKYIPITYGTYTISGSDIMYSIGMYERLTLKQLQLDTQKATLTQVDFSTRYSEKELSKILKKERDHFNITIENITLQDFNIQFKDTIPYISSTNITFTKPKLVIYRDKLVADDTTVKPLYSTMLSTMDSKLTIDNTVIKEGTVIYTEKIKDENEGGKITLSNIEGSIKNLGNTYDPNQKTIIEIKSTFMKSTPLEVAWEFTTTKPTDKFQFKGHLGNLSSEDLNPFTQPNLSVKLDGTMQDTYFSIYGDERASKIDIRMKYDDLEVSVMGKNGRGINKFLSSIVNLIIKNDSTEDTKAYRNATTTVDRDKTKSFFNYIWLNLRAGLLQIISGKDSK